MILCKILGHKYHKLQPSRGICSATLCDRCGDFIDGINWEHFTPTDMSYWAHKDIKNDILKDMLRAAIKKNSRVII
ncbi:hypothetical protein [Flavobacterium sp.]|uniref:hypothetical protein n=1 Tax=Flavobacterium sp. TaxID=239 RepID=UPI002625167D|nr:hypothetical protein [Flavobacterium sp.]